MGAKKRSAEEMRAALRRMAARVKGTASVAALLHELQVYQEELAAQNAVLRDAQSELEEARDRFIELYDFAPNGYLTLDEHGLILRTNLTGASWLGRSKSAVEGMPLLAFVEKADRPRLVDFMRQCRDHKQGVPLSVDLRLRVTGGARDVQLLCRPRTRTVQRAREFFTAMIDVTERRRLEVERADALDQRAALAGRILSIQDEERQRIARDLHDNVGQLLTVLRLKLDVVEMAIGPNQAARAPIADAQALSLALDQALDFIAAELHPTILHLGLAAALDHFAAEWSRNFGIAVTLRIPPAARVRLATDIETHLYRVAQEALHNVYKHSRAHMVIIALELRGRRVRLTIEDDGIGLDPSAGTTPAHRGLGLLSMRERVHLIGGTIEFQRGTARGTKVVADVPCEPARAAVSR